MNGLHAAFRQFDHRDSSRPIHRHDLAGGMFDLDIVEKHHLEYLGDRVTANCSRLNLGAQLRAEAGNLRLLQGRRRLRIDGSGKEHAGPRRQPRKFSQFSIMIHISFRWPASGFVSIKARKAALPELCISDPSAFLLHSRFPESRICPQQLFILLACDDVLLRGPGF